VTNRNEGKKDIRGVITPEGNQEREMSFSPQLTGALGGKKWSTKGREECRSLSKV